MRIKLPLKIAEIIGSIDQHTDQLQKLKQELKKIKKELGRFQVDTEFTDHLADFVRQMEATLEIISEMVKLTQSMMQTQETYNYVQEE